MTVIDGFVGLILTVTPGPLAGLVVLSGLQAVIIMLSFKRLVNYQTVNSLVKELKVAIYEAYLERFREKYFLKCLLRMTKIKLKLLKCVLLSVLVSGAVCVLIYTGMARRFDYRPFRSGEPILLVTGIIQLVSGSITRVDDPPAGKSYVRWHPKPSGSPVVTIGDQNITIEISTGAVPRKYYGDLEIMYPSSAGQPVFGRLTWTGLNLYLVTLFSLLIFLIPQIKIIKC